MANIILINDQDQEQTLAGVSKLVTRSTDGDMEFSLGGGGVTNGGYTIISDLPGGQGQISASLAMDEYVNSGTMSSIPTVVATAEAISITPESSYATTIDGFGMELSRPTGEKDDGTSYPEYKLLNGKTPLEKWTYDGSNSMTGLVQCQPISREEFDENTGVLKITNISDTKIYLSVDYKVESKNTSYALSIGGQTQEKADGSYISKVITPNDFIELWVTAGQTIKGGLKELPYARLTISNMKVEAVTSQTLTLLTPLNGSYAATQKKQDGSIISTVNNAGVDTKSISFNPAEDETVTLTATANEGYRFYLWEDKAGNLISAKNPVAVDGSTITADSIRPVFIADDGQLAPFAVDGINYYYWNDAMQAAAKSNGKSATLQYVEYTLPATSEVAGRIGTYATENADGTMTYTVPSGVTLYIKTRLKISSGVALQAYGSGAWLTVNAKIQVSKT